MRGENSILGHDLTGYSKVYPKLLSVIVLKMGSHVFRMGSLRGIITPIGVMIPESV